MDFYASSPRLSTSASRPRTSNASSNTFSRLRTSLRTPLLLTNLFNHGAKSLPLFRWKNLSLLNIIFSQAKKVAAVTRLSKVFPEWNLKNCREKCKNCRETSANNWVGESETICDYQHTVIKLHLLSAIFSPVSMVTVAIIFIFIFWW